MTKGNGRMKKIVTLVFVLLTLLAAAASAESYTQADFEWAEAVQDQSALTLKEQAKYLDIVKQRQRGIALLAMGGADTPFQIASAAQLAELAQYVNARDATFVSAHYALTDDVNLSAYGNWTPIGTEDKPFMGVFDGQSHVVTGLKIDRAGEGYQGLFGYVSGLDNEHKAQLKNIVVQDAQIRARAEVGAVVGRYGQFTKGFVEPLENCAMIGGTIQGTTGSLGQSSFVGGIVGRAYGEIQRCYATGSIIALDSAIDYGGIVGESYKRAVNDCYSAVNLSGTAEYTYEFGGIVGKCSGTVTNCYATGDVIGTGEHTGTFGGVVGCALGDVSNCYATGIVKGEFSIGGIVGQTDGSGSTYGTVSGCIALNASVESSPFYPIGRVASTLGTTGVLSGNYAWAEMPVNGSPVTTGNHDNLNGADLTYDDTNGLSRQFETIFGGNSAWTYAENGLPTLKNVGGTQSSEIPTWMRENGGPNTIYINTAADLAQLAADVNGGDSKRDKTYLLANDIDLSGYANWTPIGTYDYATSTELWFSGVFDGQGYTIRNLTCTSATDGFAGLFGNFNGTVQNLILRDAQITSELNAGAVVSENYGGQVLNCAMIGGSVKGNKLVGGIAGLNDGGIIENCYATGDVTYVDNSAMNNDAGGVVGSNHSGTVQNCYASGSVKAMDSRAGGVVGSNYDGGTIQNCAALGQSTSVMAGMMEARRVVGTNIRGTLGGNYAWSGMKVNGNTVTDDNAAGLNGAALSYDAATGLNAQFETIFGGDSGWTYTENGLPILKALKGAQSSELPTWVKAGSAANVVYIRTMADLTNLASAVNSGVNMSGKTFLLMNDIDLSGLNWVPIGYYIDWNNSNNKPFSGVFDGQGHSIIGLTISGGQNDAGLFGYTHLATIRNVVIRNPQIEGRGEVGALVGRQGYSSTGIEKCAVIGGRIQGAGSVGGLVGYMEESPLQNCYTTCEVIATDSYAGGIVGSHLVGASIRSCYATGNISGRYSGGIVGQARNVERCVALGQTVTGASSHRVLSEPNGKLNVYAWRSMKVNGKTVTGGAANNENGADLVYNGGALSTQFSEIFANDDAWTYTENGLPILKVVKGEQSSELPSWMLGSETTIYITTAQQLKQLADEVNAGDSKSGKTYLLANDIDLSVYPNWSPIGTYSQVSCPFSGVFDGQNHIISNLTCTSADTKGYAGLFGNFNGKVQNLILRDAQITVKGICAGTVVCENKGGQVLNCAMIGGSVKGECDVGGVVCYNEGTVENCYATGDVTALSDGWDYYAGGVVCYNEGTVQNCYAAGRVESEARAGGVVGYNIQGTIQNCVALGQSVSPKGDAHRVVGNNMGVTLGSNYAWSGMQVNGQPVTDGLADNENGEDILAHNGLLYGKGGQIFAWPGFDTSIWELRNDQPGKLPRFKGTSADPTLNLTAQGSTVTCDVELNGDAGVSGFRYKVNDAANDTEYSGVFTVNLLDKLEIEPTIRTGYAFAQWNDGKTDNPYTMAVTGAVSLTAQAKVMTYAIDYALNGGALEEGQANPTTYTVETPSFELKNPVRTGYTFAGWTGSNGTGPQTTVGIVQGSTGNLYFEANWTANGYKILYTGVDGADVSAFPTKHVFGKDTAIPNPTKTGYGFAGWKVNGSAATRDLTLSGTAYTADITLEATWTKLTEPTPSVIMEGGTAFIVGKATEDAIMHIGKGVANFGVANLDYVDVDGKRLDPQFYTAKDGSIILTVHQAYLNTLSVGEHILTAHLKGPGYEGQTVSGKIVVAPVPDMSNLPQTGDASPVLLWGAMLGACAAGFALLKRKKR